MQCNAKCKSVSGNEYRVDIIRIFYCHIRRLCFSSYLINFLNQLQKKLQKEFRIQKLQFIIFHFFSSIFAEYISSSWYYFAFKFEIECLLKTLKFSWSLLRWSVNYLIYFTNLYLILLCENVSTNLYSSVSLWITCLQPISKMNWNSYLWLRSTIRSFSL